MQVCSSPVGGMLFGVSGILLLLSVQELQELSYSPPLQSSTPVVNIPPLPPPMRLWGGQVFEFVTACFCFALVPVWEV